VEKSDCVRSDRGLRTDYLYTYYCQTKNLVATVIYDSHVMYAGVCVKSYFMQFKKLTYEKVNKMSTFIPSKWFQYCRTFSPQSWKINRDCKK